MTSSRPYLLRALYEWLADNQQTPQILVNAEIPGVKVPPHAVKEGKITLNISMTAVRELELGDDAVSFSARFGGTPFAVYVPVSAVLAIFSRENTQHCVMFPDEPQTDDEEDTLSKSPEKESPSGGASHLKVVK